MHGKGYTYKHDYTATGKKPPKGWGNAEASANIMLQKYLRVLLLYCTHYGYNKTFEIIGSGHLRFLELFDCFNPVSM